VRSPSPAPFSPNLRLPSDRRALSASPVARARSEYGEIAQQRDDPDNDDDELDDLLGAPVDRQARDQIEHQYDNQECNKQADQDGHVHLSEKCWRMRQIAQTCGMG